MRHGIVETHPKQQAPERPAPAPPEKYGVNAAGDQPRRPGCLARRFFSPSPRNFLGSTPYYTTGVFPFGCHSVLSQPAAGAMLYIVGLGLGDERDITVRGLDAVRSCSKIYMEAYTSLLSLGLDPAALANLVRLPSLVRPSPVRANTHVARSEFHWRSRFLLCASRRSCTGRR